MTQQPEQDVVEQVLHTEAMDAVDAAIPSGAHRDKLTRYIRQQALSASNGGWMPIESAPKDEWILIYDDRYRHSASSYLIAKWHKPFGQWQGKPNSKGRFALWGEATHWQPLPAPPTSGKGE